MLHAAPAVAGHRVVPSFEFPLRGVWLDTESCACVCCTQVRVYLSSMQDGLPGFKDAWNAWVDHGSLPVSESWVSGCVHCVGLDMRACGAPLTRCVLDGCCHRSQVLTVLHGAGPFSNCGVVLEADAYIGPC